MRPKLFLCALLAWLAFWPMADAATTQAYNGVSASLAAATTSADLVGAATQLQDLDVQITVANQVQWQISPDGANYTDLLNVVIGSVIRLPAGYRLRLRNTDGAAAHRYVIVYWPRTIQGG